VVKGSNKIIVEKKLFNLI